MKRQMWAGMFGMGMSVALTAGLAAGCGQEKKVDYTIEGISEEAQSQGKGGKSSLEQFEGEEIWKETWSSQIEEGVEMDGEIYQMVTDIQVDARVTVPQTKQMAVIEVKEPEFDENYKRNVAESLFESGEIFYGDIAHLPGKDLKKLQPDKITPEQKEILAHIDPETAGDTYKIVEAYTVNEYIGRYNGRLYNLSFAELQGEKCRLKQILLFPKDLKEVCPEKYKDQKELACTPWMLGDYAENECRLSEEDAQKEARLFVENLGLDYPVVSHIRPLVWGDPLELASLTIENKSDSWGLNGYVFSFDLGVDDISFVDFGAEEDYKHPWYYGAEWSWLNIDIEEKTQYSLNARLEVYVTDQGVIGMTANNPMEITGVSEGVELLPLDTIKRILKEALEKSWKSFRFDFTTKFFDGMELIYFRVQDKENPGKYSYVPVWRLSNVIRDPATHQITIRNPVFINAIDGSVVDFYEEIYHIPPVEE